MVIEDNDYAHDLAERVAAAHASAMPLRIMGGNSKGFLGCRFDGEELDVAAHSGIVEYEPNELVLSARAGTRLTDIEAVLSRHDQVLGFEPPRHAPSATLGGTLACNVSGPARPWLGSVRDAVLGVRLINGRGEHMRFGGRVIKNVAGFDVSRLQAGAYGALGVLTEISMKVLPKPETTGTRRFALDARAAVARMNELSGTRAPLTGAAWSAGHMYLRLSGARSAVEAAGKSLGGDEIDNDFWVSLRDQQLDVFTAPDARPLWRVSVKPTSNVLLDEDTLLLDWGGAQRFVRTPLGLAEMSRIAESAGGHAMRMSNNDANHEFMQQPGTGLRSLHERVKQAFDPARILNRGRLYSWF